MRWLGLNEEITPGLGSEPYFVYRKCYLELLFSWEKKAFKILLGIHAPSEFLN